MKITVNTPDLVRFEDVPIGSAFKVPEWNLNMVYLKINKIEAHCLGHPYYHSNMGDNPKVLVAKEVIVNF